MPPGQLESTGTKAYIDFYDNGDVVLNGSTVVSDFGNAFGFYIGPNGSTTNYFYSEDSLNGDNPQALIYQGKGDQVKIGNYFSGSDKDHYYLAFEDLPYGSSDKDYNDMVVMAYGIQPVPEPASMMLLGTGLFGLAGVARRRFRK